MAKITKKAELAALADAVGEIGKDFVYDLDGGCYYVRDFTPSCGVGHALHKLGVPIEVLEEMDNVGNSSIAAGPVQSVLAQEGFPLSPAALRVLRRFQADQDVRVPWGSCLTAARKSKPGDSGR